MISTIDSYSPKDIEQLRKLSSAADRYLYFMTSKACNFSEDLRLRRSKAWTEAAAATLLKTHSAKDICLAWSQFTDQSLKECWTEHGLDQQPMACFAFGKLGAKELNLSSDIDLVILSEGPATSEMNAQLRNFTKELTKSTALGFCYRVDYDLRPGGRFSPLISSLAQAEDHYWTRGQTWERLALIRARPVCGTQNTITRAQEIFKSFSFRKYINYSLFDDLKTLRSDIFQYRPEAPTTGLHLKLTEGGIRDIELFIHALQIVHGGRIEKIQVKGTSDIIDLLIQESCGRPEDLKFLDQLYWRLRSYENEVQAMGDQQTHFLPLNQPNSKEYQDLLTDTLRASQIVSEILGTVDSSEGLPLQPEEQDAWLSNLGYSRDIREKTWPSILKLTAKSSRYSHDEKARKGALKKFCERIAEGIDPDLGLQYLCDFIYATRAKSSFFSLLIHEPKLIHDLSSLFSTSPGLSQILVNRPELLDSFVFNAQDTVTSDSIEFYDELFERKLLADIHYSLSFLDNFDVLNLGVRLSELADSVFSSIIEAVCASMGTKIEILRLGKWAGYELGFQSDLDMLFLTQGQVNEAHHKVARRILSRLTEMHKGGQFYKVDLRLRPSGSAGPLIISQEKFFDYLQNQAEPWERQSYFKSRLHPRFDEQVRSSLLQKRFSPADLKQLKNIRTQLLQTTVPDLKYSPGGLIDIEFAAQIACMQNQISVDDASTITSLDALKAAKLVKNYSRLRTFEQALQLLTQTSHWSLDASRQEIVRLGRVFKVTPQQIIDEILSLFHDNKKALKELDPIWAND